MAESEGNLTAARTRSNEVEAKLGAAPSELFARLFPDIQGCTEEKAALHISTLNSSVPAGDEVEKLEGQVEHYKGVLAQTESMLTSPQASVESAESEWRVKLDASTKVGITTIFTITIFTITMVIVVNILFRSLQMLAGRHQALQKRQQLLSKKSPKVLMLERLVIILLILLILPILLLLLLILIKVLTHAGEVAHL